MYFWVLTRGSISEGVMSLEISNRLLWWARALIRKGVAKDLDLRSDLQRVDLQLKRHPGFRISWRHMLRQSGRPAAVGPTTHALCFQLWHSAVGNLEESFFVLGVGVPPIRDLEKHYHRV